MTALAPTVERKTRTRQVPDYLISDIINGKKYYYRGYRQVLSGQRTLNEIMACSTLQAFIVNYLVSLLIRRLDEEKYLTLFNELGVQFKKYEWVSCDIAVFKTSVLKPGMIDVHLASAVPEVVVEVDVQIDLNNTKSIDYVNNKTSAMLRHGVKKVIWIFTTAQRILIAEQGETDWRWRSWDESVPLLEGIAFNIGEHLKKKGINV